MFPGWIGEKFVVTTDPNNAEVTILYGELLSEISRRCDLVRGVLENKFPMHRVFSIEMCYLQFRNVCELIALACISAHGDIAEVRSKKLQDTYQADIIIKYMLRINAEFYPVPIKMIINKGQHGKNKIETLEGVPHLTRGELLELYHLSSGFLHVGPFSKLIADEKKDYSIAGVRTWLKKIDTLIDNHVIKILQHRICPIQQRNPALKRKNCHAVFRIKSNYLR